MRFRLLSTFVVLPMLAAIAKPGRAAEPYWQCAAFARQYSGIAIRGDAWTWWTQADGRYAKGQRPRVGAVMSFAPSNALRLGHVATVTRLLGPREIAVTHANWSPIGGVRGQIEYDVLVRDVSESGDWSRVRVWYGPIADLGSGTYPLDGFIYPGNIIDRPQTIARADAPSSVQPLPRLAYARIDRLIVGEAMGTDGHQRLRLGRDLIRLAQLEDRQGR